MRLLPTTLAVVIAASTFSIPAQADDQLSSNICNYVQADDKNRLRKNLKESRVKLRNIYSDISCNGDSILRFATKNGADMVGTFVAKRLPVSDLTSPEGDGMTIVQWAEANGHGGSAIVATIVERIAGG